MMIHAEDIDSSYENGRISDRLTSLDGLRGAAAVGVVFFHMDSMVGTLTSSTSGYSQESWIWQMYRRLIDGNFAVCLFFVLSGFVLVSSFKKTNNFNLLSRGVLKRYFRLTPLALFSIICVFLLGTSKNFYNVQASELMGGHDWLQHIFDFKFKFSESLKEGVYGIYIGNFRYNGVLWTIGIELWGSIFLFAFVGLFYRARRFNALIWIAILIVPMINGLTGFYVSLFLMGAYLLFNERHSKSFFWGVFGFYLGTFNPWCFEVQYIDHLLNPKFLIIPVDVLAHGVGAFFLVSAVLGNPLIKSMFETKVLVLFGKLSFVIYVLHLPVLMSVGCGVFVLFGSGLDLKLAASLSLFSTFTVTFVLSFLAYKLVDLPAQILANRFSDLFIDRTSK